MSFQLLPTPAPDDLRRLRESIAERGVEVAIVVDEDGNVLDGHHRAAIAAELGVSCPRVVKSGLSDHEKRLLAVELNLARRQLTDAQKAVLGRQIEPDIAARAKERQKASLRQGGRPPSGSIDPDGENKPPTTLATPETNGADVERRSRDEVARAVGLGSGRTYERAKEAIEAVERVAPELLPKIEAGEVDLPEVRREVKRRAPASPLARAFLQAGEEAVANAPQESIDAFADLVIESQEMPVTAESLAKAISLLSRADREFRDIRPDLLQRLLLVEPDERQRLNRAVDLLTAMLARCREWSGAKGGKLRRIV